MEKTREGKGEIMEKVSCEIVCDLLPSYYDQITSDTTKEVLSEHLSHCDTCRLQYENRIRHWKQEEELESVRGREFHEKLLNYRYYAIGFCIGLLFPVAVLLGCGLINALCTFFMLEFW